MTPGILVPAEDVIRGIVAGGHHLHHGGDRALHVGKLAVGKAQAGGSADGKNRVAADAQPPRRGTHELGQAADILLLEGSGPAPAHNLGHHVRGIPMAPSTAGAAELMSKPELPPNTETQSFNPPRGT